MAIINKISIIVLSFLVFILLLINLGAYDSIKYSFFDKVEVPKEFYVCFKELDKTADEATKAEFKETNEKDLSKYHFGLGLYIRNNWISHDELNINLEKVLFDLGIRSADDMSGVIITSYHRYLNNESIQLKEQLDKMYSSNYLIKGSENMEAVLFLTIYQLLIYALLLMLKNKLNFTLYKIAFFVTGFIWIVTGIVIILGFESDVFLYFWMINFVTLLSSIVYLIIYMIKWYIGKRDKSKGNL